MNKFYSYLLATLSYIFLAAAVIYIFAFLSASPNEMGNEWPIFVGIELGCMLAAAVCWVLRSVLIYTSRNNEEAEDDYPAE